MTNEERMLELTKKFREEGASGLCALRMALQSMEGKVDGECRCRRRDGHGVLRTCDWWSFPEWLKTDEGRK